MFYKKIVLSCYVPIKYSCYRRLICFTMSLFVGMLLKYSIVVVLSMPVVVMAKHRWCGGKSHHRNPMSSGSKGRSWRASRVKTVTLMKAGRLTDSLMNEIMLVVGTYTEVGFRAVTSQLMS